MVMKKSADRARSGVLHARARAADRRAHCAVTVFDNRRSTDWGTANVAVTGLGIEAIDQHPVGRGPAVRPHGTGRLLGVHDRAIARFATPADGSHRSESPRFA